MRLIDADRLKSYIDCGHLRPPTEVCFSEFDVCSMIDKAPTIEPSEQVTGKLKKPCDSLLKEDSDGCKEHKSKLDHGKEWIIGCIKHDGFIHTARFDKANQIIIDALEAPSGVNLDESCDDCPLYDGERHSCPRFNKVIPQTIADLKAEPSIVRCGDCRHAYYADNRVEHEKTWVCERFMNEEITSNDFCSWGERKGGDTE